MNTNKLTFVEDSGRQSVAEQKNRLRGYARTRRADNENRDVKEDLLLGNFFKALESLEKDSTGAGTKRSVFIYLSYSSEAPTDKLIEALLEKGFSIYCPRVEKGEMYAVEYGEDFTLSATGIREPLGEICKADCDLAIVPLLAADEKGNRLGYGGGYYDLYFKKHPRTKRIGYCFDFQVLASVPHTDEDEKLDLIVTDKRFFSVST